MGQWEGLVYQYGKVNFVEGKPETESAEKYQKITKDNEETEENEESHFTQNSYHG